MQPQDCELPTSRQLAVALARHATPSSATGIRLVVVDYAVLVSGLLLAALADAVWLRLVGAVMAGAKMSGLYTLAHDAAHDSLTASSRLNKALAVLCYLPLFFNYRLWLHDHNATHHRYTNGPQPDAYTPMSPEAYAAAPRWRQWWERFGRSGNPLSFAPFYILGRYAEGKIWPTREFPADVRRQAWPYLALSAVYLMLMLAGLAVVSQGDVARLAQGIVFTLCIPFLIFQTMLALVLYLQHTHPDIPWLRADDPLRAGFGQEVLTARIQVPALLGALTHYPFDHSAHHVCPAVPCYRLPEAQAHLRQLMGGRGIEVPLSWNEVAEVFRRCKLYDYNQHRWVDFQGRPTTARPHVAPAARLPGSVAIG